MSFHGQVLKKWEMKAHIKIQQALRCNDMSILIFSFSFVFASYDKNVPSPYIDLWWFLQDFLCVKDSEVVHQAFLLGPCSLPKTTQVMRPLSHQPYLAPVTWAGPSPRRHNRESVAWCLTLQASTTTHWAISTHFKVTGSWWLLGYLWESLAV